MKNRLFSFLALIVVLGTTPASIEAQVSEPSLLCRELFNERDRLRERLEPLFAARTAWNIAWVDVLRAVIDARALEARSNGMLSTNVSEARARVRELSGPAEEAYDNLRNLERELGDFEDKLEDVEELIESRCSG